MFAINLGDLAQDSQNHRFVHLLIRPVLDASKIVLAEPNKADGCAVVLACDDARAEAIVHIIRMKFSKSALRCYSNITKTGKVGKTWHRV